MDIEIPITRSNLKAGAKKCYKKNKEVAPPAHIYDLYQKGLTDTDMRPILAGIQESQGQNQEESQINILLSNNLIGFKGCQYLARCNWLSTLSLLHVDYNLIGDHGCLIISKANWPDLQQLNLMGNNITDKGCSYLTKASWTKLSEMYLHQNNIKRSGYTLLSNRFIQCSIEVDEQYLYAEE